MKHSIRVKFTMIFIGLMAAVLVSMWAVNSFFLESFYTKQKLQLLENAYENLNAIAVDKEFLGENITEDLQSLYSNDGEQTEASRLLRLMNDKYNTTIVIQDSITGELIPLAKDGKFLADALHRYILGIIDPRTETLISQDDHQVQKIYDRRSQGYYLQSWGFFDDNRTMFIMSMPLASIHDSVSISNEFLAYVGLAALVLGSALMYYATKKVVSPIRSLAALSARMSELDFEARYTGDSEDEIGVLGHSMNTLSEQMCIRDRFIVGDDDQSIYRFRGAKPELMLGFERDYPDAKKILLDTNYRCSRQIVEAAGRVISHNRTRFPKEIKAARGNGHPVIIKAWQEPMDETLGIVTEIRDYASMGISYNDMAVLYRTNVGPRLLISKLMEYNIPFYMRDADVYKRQYQGGPFQH